MRKRGHWNEDDYSFTVSDVVTRKSRGRFARFA